MLTTLELAIYAAAVVVALPAALYSLMTGSRPPEMGLFVRYYRAQKHLSLAGNLFLLAVCAHALVKLGLHFGYIAPGLTEKVMFLTGLAFGATLLLFLGLWIAAAVRVRGGASGPA
jgi:hypothetical protein